MAILTAVSVTAPRYGVTASWHRPGKHCGNVVDDLVTEGFAA
jgi:hypothetical protein